MNDREKFGITVVLIALFGGFVVGMIAGVLP